MGKVNTKKHAKGRLDKYYHMAKEQGYRARSAFKLIQLNKKFDFLEKSKVLIDLCAAPGGWLQVAAKYMPKQSIIIGLDLAPIKPIPNVITFVEDITTDKCKATLKSQLKHFKADTVLHDGAPNVGKSWLHDAFTQSELVLSSLKLATQFLAPEGNFITKVFRSKDYNKLLWVFNQLFKKVEATKPASSRNVSAEIFVVCTGYLAPKKIDPKFLDAKWVFKEVDDFEGLEEMDEKKKKERQSTILNDLLHPEKRHRHREGYEDGNYTQFTPSSIVQFVKGNDHIELLARSSSLIFDDNEAGTEIKTHPLTTIELKECIKDLKVLGKKDFKMMLKWREQIRLSLGIDKSRKQKKEELDAKLSNSNVEIEETPESIAEKLSLETLTAEAKLKRQKKKIREKKAKTLLKLRYGMETPMDVGIDASNVLLDDAEDTAVGGSGSLFSINKINNSANEVDVLSASEEEKNDDSESGSEIFDSDEEIEHKITSMEQDLDGLYENFRLRQAEKDPAAHMKQQKKENKLKGKKAMKEQFEEWYGVEYEKKKEQFVKQLGDESDADDVSDSNDDVLLTDSESEKDSEFEDAKPLSDRAKKFFDNPVFNSMKTDNLKRKKKENVAPNGGNFDKEMEICSSSEDEEDKEIRKLNRKKRKTGLEEVDEQEVEYVPAESEQNPEDFSDDEFLIKTARDYTIAQKLIHPSGKRDLIDDAFNRYSFNDEEGSLPEWFIADESRHKKIHIPVTKEAVQTMKDRLRELNDRPIKKIAEAKFRKQYRQIKRQEKFLNKANAINDDEDLPDKAKAKHIVKTLLQGKKVKRDKAPKLVVAKMGNKGVKGRPKGVKGKYKMVDSRMKKELRADKRQKKATKKKRR
ncbi:AdoMet-dependent rRNA methyltransferase spb1 [Clydaea vesicula]|uniref:AdoMet-dependent rRNA methyltransferase spb1 n=1 Tax=Clydaea vesicula TaxID=447962 RepID=A0AAD5XYW8_9FUNG|nr:AdoMet-dependent rRNA methyltransferase spb1 [Clydaea vesicula]KAJ3388497.1 AdoMet-dependent rRNA methyltransferase spb1 [Lobulomyces angularis]